MVVFCGDMRSFPIRAGSEHKQPICDYWAQLCSGRCISYEWAACDCSLVERDYQLLVGSEWKTVKFCPFCGSRINAELVGWEVVNVNGNQ
jgi:hypothetical protein